MKMYSEGILRRHQSCPLLLFSLMIYPSLCSYCCGSNFHKFSVLVSVNCEVIHKKNCETRLNFFISSQHSQLARVFPIKWIKMDGRCQFRLNRFSRSRLAVVSQRGRSIDFGTRTLAIVVSTNVCSINLCGPDKLTAISRGHSSWKLLIALVARTPV